MRDFGGACWGTARPDALTAFIYAGIVLLVVLGVSVLVHLHNLDEACRAAGGEPIRHACVRPGTVIHP